MALATYDVLLKALQEENTEAFESILKRDGLPGDGLDYKLLQEAISGDNKSICTLLLNNGCGVSEFNLGARTSGPLYRVVRKPGWYDITEKILNCGARVSDDNASGYTALHSAFYDDKADGCVVELLLNRFLNETTLDLKDSNGLRCIHIASAKASVDCVKRCLTICNVDAQVSSLRESTHAGYSSLHFAVVNDRLDVADFLCQNNANVYVQNHDDSTPIHLALELRNVGMIDLLFQYDRKYENCTNRYDLTHFMAACAGNSPLVVEQYLRVADENSSTSDEALMSRVVPKSRHYTPGQRVGYPWEIPYYPFAGYSAFYFAVEFSNCQNLPTLLGRGAYCSLKNLRPINVNCHLRRGIIFDLIRNHYARCRSCGRRNFVYKRLACSNDGIRFLNDTRKRLMCLRTSCMIKLYVFVGIIIFIIVFSVVLAKLGDGTSKKYEVTSFPTIQYPIPTLRPWSDRSARY